MDVIGLRVKGYSPNNEESNESRGPERWAYVTSPPFSRNSQKRNPKTLDWVKRLGCRVQGFGALLLKKSQTSSPTTLEGSTWKHKRGSVKHHNSKG